jgi:hypothetical protein
MFSACSRPSTDAVVLSHRFMQPQCPPLYRFTGLTLGVIIILLETSAGDCCLIGSPKYIRSFSSFLPTVGFCSHRSPSQYLDMWERVPRCSLKFGALRLTTTPPQAQRQEHGIASLTSYYCPDWILLLPKFQQSAPRLNEPCISEWKCEDCT